MRWKNAGLDFNVSEGENAQSYPDDCLHSLKAMLLAAGIFIGNRLANVTFKSYPTSFFGGRTVVQPFCGLGRTRISRSSTKRFAFGGALARRSFRLLVTS